MKEKKSVPQYTEVWNDTVVLRELLMSCLISIILTMSFFLLGKFYFNNLEGLDSGMADGFALLFGLIFMLAFYEAGPLGVLVTLSLGLFGGILNNYFDIHTGVQFMAYYASGWIVSMLMSLV